jgi:hypothetical protein
MIGDATFAQTPGGCNLSYKGRTMKRIDSKALRAAYPAIAAECEKVSEFRVLLPCKSIPDALLAEAMAERSAAGRDAWRRRLADHRRAGHPGILRRSSGAATFTPFHGEKPHVRSPQDVRRRYHPCRRILN